MLNFVLGPEVRQGPTVTEVTGLNWYSFDTDIKRLYGTSTPGKYMFRRVTSNKFVTDNFFLLELNYLIQQLIQLDYTSSKRKALS